MAQATALILDSTEAADPECPLSGRYWGQSGVRRETGKE
jgi:hypothetical protein